MKAYVYHVFKPLGLGLEIPENPSELASFRPGKVLRLPASPESLGPGFQCLEGSRYLEACPQGGSRWHLSGSSELGVSFRVPDFSQMHLVRKAMFMG